MDEQETSTREDLERILFNIGQTEPTAAMGFSIDLPDKAAWAARKILQAEERIGRNTQMADEYRNRIEAWYAQTTKHDLESISFLKGLLKPYAERAIADSRKGKTLRFPGIIVSLRKLPDRLEVTDESLALRYCEKSHKEAVETKKSLIRSEVKKFLTEGGVIPGVDIIPGSEEIYVSDEAEKQSAKERKNNVAA